MLYIHICMYLHICEMFIKHSRARARASCTRALAHSRLPHLRVLQHSRDDVVLGVAEAAIRASAVIGAGQEEASGGRATTVDGARRAAAASAASSSLC